VSRGTSSRSTPYQSKTSAEGFLSELQDAVEDDSLYTNADGKPNRVHFDRHLYLPLIAEETNVDEEDIDYRHRR